MTKEQFLNKWRFGSNPLFEADIEALIANEIAKVQEAKPEDTKPQPALNPIEQAYERGEKIRHKNWLNGDWIQKHNETKTIDNNGYLNSVFTFGFIQDPEKWELYTEPTEQPAKQFDRDRFEAMFRAVVMGSGNPFTGDEFSLTEYIITKLDAYYASKEGGNNG